ncbi:MAG TPA: STAS domain-containing protein [Candidatus Saccharimonadales bacterium]|jgi:anti-anti-sigma factor|nr:STAS domain-containing protein [Candidatus Saccharimonadales bacterium]
MAATPEATAPVRYRDGTAVVDLPAQIDSTAEHALNGAYATAADHGSKTVLLNFSGVEFLSSTGIALIVGILARARRDGRKITAAGLSDHYKEIFEITRLADFMTIFADENAALGGAR